MSYQTMRRRSKGGLRTAIFFDMITPVRNNAEIQLFMDLVKSPKYLTNRTINCEIIATDWNMHVRRSSQMPPDKMSFDHDLQYKDGPSLRKFQEMLKDERFLHHSRLSNQQPPIAFPAKQVPFGMPQQFLMAPMLQGAVPSHPVPSMASPMPLMPHNAPGPQAGPPLHAAPVAGMHELIQHPTATSASTQLAPMPSVPAGPMPAMPRPPAAASKPAAAAKKGGAKGHGDFCRDCRAAGAGEVSLKDGHAKHCPNKGEYLGSLQCYFAICPDFQSSVASLGAIVSLQASVTCGLGYVIVD